MTIHRLMRESVEREASRARSYMVLRDMLRGQSQFGDISKILAIKPAMVLRVPFGPGRRVDFVPVSMDEMGYQTPLRGLSDTILSPVGLELHYDYGFSSNFLIFRLHYLHKPLRHHFWERPRTLADRGYGKLVDMDSAVLSFGDSYHGYSGCKHLMDDPKLDFFDPDVFFKSVDDSLRCLRP